MSDSGGWKIATCVLAAASLALAGALVSRPVPIATATPPAHSTDAAGGRESPPQERRHAEPPPAVDPERAATEAAQVIADARAAKHAAALEAMTIEDVCRLHLLPIEGHSPFQGATMEQVVARLDQDPERAAAILEDWLRRRDEIRGAGLTGPVRGWVSMAYVGLRGAEAAPLLREIVLEQQDLEHLPALLRTGDPESLQELDGWQRSLDDGTIGPYLVTSGGPNGIQLIRGWAFDESVRETLRVKSQKCLWSFGTDADRERLLRTVSREQVISDFFHVRAFDERARENWRERLKELVIAALDHEDPWVRLLAVQRALRRHAPWSASPWPTDVIAHAADAGRTLIQLPPPGGRDPKQWERIRDKVAAQIDELEKRPEHERRVREVLGLDEPEGTDTE